ncbi:MAG: LLM class flavin-dependent oxidoreductase [Aggregatilineales bacterium]
MIRRELSIALQTDKTPAQYVELAQLVDGYGFDALTVYGDLPFHPSFGPLLLMAPHVRRARLGPAGVSPSRMSPVDIAASAALLALATPGGAYLGLVRGAWLAEHGIREPDDPIRAIRETIEIVRALHTGAPGGYEGQVYRLAGHVRAPYPLPEQPVPVLIGTWGPRLAALAGELADEVKVGGSANPDMVPVMQGYIGAGEARAGRPVGTVGVVLGAVTVVDEDREAARALARREVALYLPVVARLDPTVEVPLDLVERIRQHVNTGEPDRAARLISDDLLGRFAFAGTPADLIEHCEAIFEAGARRVEFGTPHGLSAGEGIRLLGEKVLPALRSARG